MSVSWTKEQLQVITLRSRNILVSAAAGSGKTAVLVERIIGLITDEKQPVDIDSLLIVTFTNAAAAEMRERIGAAIEAKVEEQPDNIHLQRQLTLVHHAQITTIHSFCLNVIRSYFHKIDLDPSFRIGDEGELKLLKQEVADELLERHYAEAAEGFLDFVDTFAAGKDDSGISDLILRCYEFSRSYPWPEEWLADCCNAYEVPTEEALEQTDWMRFLKEQMEMELQEQAGNAAKMQEICEDNDGPAYLLPAICSDVEQLEAAGRFTSFAEGQERLRSITFERMPRKKKTDVFDEQKLEQVKLMRDSIKKAVGKIQKSYCQASLSQILWQLRKAAPAVRQITSLASEFAEDYTQAKRERNLVDFGDLEHFALEILTTREDGKVVRTDVAEQYSQAFSEIMIDEYQDSNLVQEVILNSISREPQGHPNVFMVGDVKQSIYKFRLARPELFMQKYHEYTVEDSLYQKIELHKNFRSRASVLEGINFFFDQIMQEELGGIAYTEETALHPGLTFAETEEAVGGPVELLLLDLSDSSQAQEEDGIRKDDPTESGLQTAAEAENAGADSQAADTGNDEAAAEPGSREWEARLVGQRILELVSPEHPQYVWDKEAKCYRPASYRDIVILLRSLTGWSEVFVDTLMDMGIPVYAESRNGYFTTIEVQTVLNLLHIIDNPMQDIPLAAVLHSPLAGFESRELAEIVSVYPAREAGGGLYEALRFYHAHFQEEEHAERPEGKEQCETTAQELAEGERREETRKTAENQCRAGAQNSSAETAQGLWKRVDAFLADLERYRDLAGYLPLHSLLERILEETGYYHYVSLMPGGERRRGNIDMLLQKALSYETTSYKGVFHFIRYIEMLQKYSVDFGEASVIGENDDTVRIMSIHKSKGLEFPIVFLSGCGKKFNTQDTVAKVVFHPEYGMGVDAIHPESRTKTATLIKRAFGERMRLENLAEEIRVLYVALTRAKEKLIMTGTSSKLEDLLRKNTLQATPGGAHVNYGILSKAASYLDFLLPALCSHTELYDLGNGALRNRIIIPDGEGLPLIDVQMLSCSDLLEAHNESAEEQAVQMEEFLQWDDMQIQNPVWAEEIARRFSYSYAYDRLAQIYTTMSVSELKRLAIGEETEEETAQLYSIPYEPTVPRFIEEERHGEEAKAAEEHAEEDGAETAKEDGQETVKEDRKETGKEDDAEEKKIPVSTVSGARRGTLYHLVMEHMSYEETVTQERIEETLEEMIKDGIITEEESRLIWIPKILGFFQTPLYKRMYDAKDSVHKEQQFIIGLTMQELSAQGAAAFGADTAGALPLTDVTRAGGDFAMVQGIIDLYFEEEDGLVLLDYKTDRVKSEEELADRYRVQLDYYQLALEKMTGRRVKERYIYSFCFGKLIQA